MTTPDLTDEQRREVAAEFARRRAEARAADQAAIDEVLRLAGLDSPPSIPDQTKTAQ